MSSRLATCGLLLLLTACTEETFDTTRRTEPRGTLGEEIFRIFHRDFERENERRAQGFALAKDGFVAAVDHIFPPDELSYTQEFMVKLVALQDDGTIPNATRMLAGVVDRLAQDRDALDSIARCFQRIGYVDLAHEQALIRRIARYPEYRALTKAILRMHREHDGFDQTGNLDPNESDAGRRLGRLLAERLANLEISEDTERGIVLAAELLMKEDQRLAPATPSAPVEVVSRDTRGMAKVRAVVAPFVDQSPRDGLPDVDGGGRFVTAAGMPLDLPPFGTTTAPGSQRDTNGRLVTETGELMFEYIDLDRTIMAGLMRDGRQLIEDGVPMRAIRTLDTVLGERLPGGTYGSENSGLLDLVHAIGAAGDIDQLPEALYLIRVLLENHEATAAWLMLETEEQMAIADRYNVNLRQSSTFFNDLMGVLRKILVHPGLAEDVLRALEDPAIATMPEVQAKLLRFKKDRITVDDVAANNVFVEEVDRTRPDQAGNHSLMQRMLHLMYDTSGVRYQPELIGIPLGFIFQIDDLAEFYMLSIIGEAEIPSLVSTLTGLSERPGPEELAAFINTDQQFGNPQGKEGIDVKDNDGDSLFAVTASGMADCLRPLIRVFYDKGQLDLLLELFEVLHMHWATAQSDYQDRSTSAPRYSKLSGIRGYEPLLIDTFENARVLDATRKLLLEIKEVRTQRGRAAQEMLLIIARKLINKDGELKARDGKREVFFDGERVTPLSPFDLIRFSRARLKSAIRRSAASQADWDAVVDALHRTLLEVERVGPESGRLKNPRALPITTALLAFLEERAEKHAAARQLSKWIREDLPKTVEEAITAPELPAMFDMIYAIEADAELTAILTPLRDELFDEARGFPDLLITTADLLETSKDASTAVPFLRWLGRELDPDKKLMFMLVDLTERSLAADSDEHMLEVMRRSIDDLEVACGSFRCREFYADGLAHAIRQAHRTNPLDTKIPDAADIERIAGAIGRYMLDDQHGLEKFYDIVKKRKLEAWQ